MPHFRSGIPVGSRPEDHAGIMGCIEQPWLVSESIDFIFDRLNDRSIVFEYGSGSSTFWFSKIVDKVYSVDHDHSWVNQLNSLIADHGISNISLSLMSCEMRYILDIDSETEEQYVNYSKTIKNTGISLFDVILVDGVARSLCIEESIPYLKKGGMLIIDNAERPAYHKAIEKIPASWNKYEFSCPVDTTLVFIRK